jgi:hypothetical protein
LDSEEVFIFQGVRDWNLGVRIERWWNAIVNQLKAVKTQIFHVVTNQVLRHGSTSGASSSATTTSTSPSSTSTTHDKAFVSDNSFASNEQLMVEVWKIKVAMQDASCRMQDAEYVLYESEDENEMGE